MIDRQDTEQRIYAIVAEKLSIDLSRVTPESTLQDLGADSLDMVEIIMQLEESFEIQINDTEAEQLHTMHDVVEYVHAQRKV